MIFTDRGIFGFDISTYQDSPAIPGNVDFRKMRDYGASFVIIKAGQGDWMDPDFWTNWHNSKGVLPRSSYWYYDNHYDPKVQAQKYWNILKIDPEGVCWVDLEDRESGGGWRKWYDFLEEFRRVSGMPSERVGIYTGFYYWTEYLKLATEAQLEYFALYPLWLASYPPDPFHPDYKNILCPPPWCTPLILQSGTPAIGKAAGVESLDIDYDIFNGDLARFSNYFDLSIKPPEGDGTAEPPQEETGETMITYKGFCTYEGAKVWDKPGGQQVGRLLHKGESVTGDGKDFYNNVEYFHLSVPVAGWTKSAWVSVAPVDVTPPPPEPEPAKTPFTLAVDGYKTYSGELEKA
jgi:GH25 family lysozyme M1 (1,4-beta-N-acetylmuramidase)